MINHAKSLHNAQDDEYITIESEMSKLEAFEAKFGIIAMQKRKRKHDKTIPEMPVTAKLGKTTSGGVDLVPPLHPAPHPGPPMPKLTPAPPALRQQVVTAPPPEPEQPDMFVLILRRHLLLLPSWLTLICITRFLMWGIVWRRVKEQ